MRVSHGHHVGASLVDRPVDAERRRVDRDVAVVRDHPVGPNEYEIGHRRRRKRHTVAQQPEMTRCVRDHGR